MADGFAKWVGGDDWYRAKKYANGHMNSGPAGRRKTRTRNQMTRMLISRVHPGSIIIHCNDQAGGHGTGYRGKYQGA